MGSISIRRAFVYALGILILTTGIGFLHLVSKGVFRAPGKLAAVLAKPAPIERLDSPSFNGEPRRSQPDFVPSSVAPALPANPTEADLMRSRALGATLWPIGSGGNSEVDDTAFADLLSRIITSTQAAKFATIEDWLRKNPASRWAPALKNQLMDFKYRNGFFADARKGWDEIWESVRNLDTLNAYNLGNDVLAHLLDVNTGWARSARLRELVAEADQRQLNAPLEGKVFRAREAVWLLDHTAAQNVMCGPLALNAIKDFLHEPFMAPRLSQVTPEFKETGLPLSEVQRYAENNYGMKMIPAFRNNGSVIPTPAVIHVKDEHFAALLKSNKDGSSYFLEDRSTGFTGWVGKTAVKEMSSGYFLIAANDLPSGWAKVTAADAGKVFGRDGAHGTTPPDESVNKNSPKTEEKSCKGMPTYTFHPMPGALLLQDIPMMYSPPVGPPVVFKVNYNDMDSGAPTSPPNFSNVGVGWSTDLVAWVEVPSALSDWLSGDDLFRTNNGPLWNYISGSSVRVRLRGGGTEVSRLTSLGVTYPDNQSFATVSLSGMHTFTRKLPDGSSEVYDAPDNPVLPGRIFLSQWTDPRGNTTSYAYDTSMRLVSITDAIGQVTTLSYEDTSDTVLVQRQLEKAS